MPVIGLTGGIGSGKSEAAACLIELGAVHVDADAISRALTAPGGEALGEIRERFGDAFFTPGGVLDRRKLGATVFANEEKRHLLEGILHPRIQRRMLDETDRARSEGAEAVILDVPLLFETGMDTLCDVTLLITAEKEERIRRVMLRDGLTRQNVEQRMKNQMDDEEREALATYTLLNDQSLDRFKAEVRDLYRRILREVRS